MELARAVTTGILLGLINMATIGGNVLVLLAVFVNRHLRSATHYFIANLAIADLLLGTAVLPFSVSLEITDRWLFGSFFCDIWAAIDVLCCTASIISLCVISVDRYIGVTRPLSYSFIMTPRKGLAVIAVVWIVSVLISIGPLMGWKKPTLKPYECGPVEDLDYVLFSASGSFYIPLVIILLVYYRIYLEAVRQSKFLASGVKVSKNYGGSQANSTQVVLRVHTGKKCGAATLAVAGAHGNDANNTELSPRKTTIAAKLSYKFARQKKAAKTLGIVVGVFILCWLPFFVILPLGKLAARSR
ncbi:PREDICTED: alpha-1B adrenergic receptor-like [Priapulus caudatus]|uniref:Alpha-1B adrenergic receptor-like n=1 Tax=Priapulus caudatus TaxID=37621 RepID=A0ABM1DTY7_PRICU|nr:PREDICTED: alpha-1B adrenergic receptor-like [Priapulus caudatus]